MKVFENENFVAVDKPPLWLSTPSRMGTSDSRPCLGTRLQTEMKCQLYPLHRLDFEVSGLIVFAKNPDSQRLASAAFEDHTVRKCYQAITNGPSDELKLGFESAWHSQLAKGKKRAFLSKSGKDCVTNATAVAIQDGKIHWLLRPLTGRPHQLRFELSHRGFPILGDLLYGSDQIWPQGIALRSVSISIPEGCALARLGWPLSLGVSDLDSFAR